MRAHVTSSPQATHHSPNPKLTPNITLHTPPTNTNTINNNNHPPLCYEPTSVLDLCRSPSPEKKPTVPKRETEDRVELEEQHVLHNLDWWDSIMKDLGLQDDSGTTLLKPNTLNSNPCIPDFPPSHDPPFDHPPDFPTLSDIYTNQNLSYTYATNNSSHLVHDFNPHNNNNCFDFIEELIRAADCFDNNNLQLAQVILDRLNQRLRSPTGKPLHRVAFHFKDALMSLLSGSNRTVTSMVEIVQTIKTFKAFSGISPIPMFSIFTTNQALLEALQDTSFIHVIDFDIGLGIQYASLMKEISEQYKTDNFPLLRITAVVAEECAAETLLVRQNLSQFAHDLGIQVQVEFLQLHTFRSASFKAVRFVDGEKIAVLISPAIFRRVGSAAAFLAEVRRVSPTVVVFVDGEGWAEAAATASFRRGVVSSMEFYSMMLESLDAAGGGDWVRRIEMMLLRPKIFAAVEGAGRRAAPPLREEFYGAGMRPVQLSQFADFQAECLLAKVQIRGFHVEKRQAELVLFWNDRALVAMSAWRC